MNRRHSRARIATGSLLTALAAALGCAGPSAGAEPGEAAEPVPVLEAGFPGAAAADDPETQAPAEVVEPVTVVWRSGISPIYYHLAGCSRLNQASQLPLANAQRHLLPCDLCNPPR